MLQLFIDLGIQAFEPVLSRRARIKIHPLVCTAYNADFDGDQMAVHVPLSAEAQAEARILMLSAHNILSTKDGRPVTVPTQDMVLGAYYLTIVRPGALGEGKIMIGINEALLAYQHKELSLQAQIKVRIDGYGMVNTTLGRMIFNESLPPEIRYYYKENDEWCLGILMDKKNLGKLVANCYRKFGSSKTAEVVDRVKTLGYSYACRAGMTVAISDIIIPPEKKEIIAATEAQVSSIEKQFRRGLITDEERYNKVINLWTQATDDVTKAMMNNFGTFNPISMMANSGARGNIQQMRQLAGMRGLMADPSGKIIDLPIKANFREGLTVLEYFISTHGARKGLADTALRTADSGYLTRRLVDVAQDVIVREDDCDIVGINLIRERAKLAKSTTGAIEVLKDSLLGRLLANEVTNPKTGEVLLQVETILDEGNLQLIGQHCIPEIVVRGTSIGYEGAISNATATETITLGAPEEHVREIIKKSMIREMLGKNTTVAVKNSVGEEIVPTHVPLTKEYIEAILASDAREVKVRNNNIRGIEVQAIKEGAAIIEHLKDRIVGRVLAEDISDAATGKVIASINQEVDEELADEIVKVREKVVIRSVLTCKSPFGVCIKCYGRNLATGHQVDVGEAVGIIAAQSIGEPGTQLTMRTFHTGGIAGDDITQGLPRVEELFEARKPKRQSIIAEAEGRAEVKETKGLRKVTVFPESGEERVYQIPYGARIIVKDGAAVELGDRLTEGSINPHDILRVCGLKATQRYLVYEVQKVYKSQGVEINDKHIEVMVRQMLHKVKVEESGDTDFLPGEFIDVNNFETENAKAIETNGEPSVARPILLGITKASLATDSFLSAASFQETTRVLTDAAIKGKVDPLLGLKENVIIGKLVPAGTGMSRYRNIKLIKKDQMVVTDTVEE